ncbi:MAG: hypothetical protein ABIY55_08110 [Kofleriaceae bacterium]
MNIKAIIASLVLGSSSVALAAPSVSFKPTATDKLGATTVRDHRIDGTRQPVARPIYRPIYRPAPAPVVIKPVIRPAPVAVYRPVAQPVHRGGWFTAGWSGGWNGWNQPVYQPVVYQPPVYQQQPVTLATGLSFYGQDRKFITVGAQAGRFGKLELSASEGQPFVSGVYVQFDDGQEQYLRNLDRTLTPGQCLTLDLDGDQRAIKRIIVYGTGTTNKWQGSAGELTVTAA